MRLPNPARKSLRKRADLCQTWYGDTGGGEGLGMFTSRRAALRSLAGAATGVLLLNACTSPRRQPGSGAPSGRAPTVPSAPTAPTADTSTVPARPDFLYMTILTGEMVGKPGWPLFVPANFTVPANAIVQAEIRCFDNGPAPIAAGYNKVTGTADGRMVVIPAVTGDLQSVTGQYLSALDPSKVSHTFTIGRLTLNVPIPALSTVRFTFKTGAPGSYPWQCMAACGTGSGGWQGTMATPGWMQGTMTVQV